MTSAPSTANGGGLLPPGGTRPSPFTNGPGAAKGVAKPLEPPKYDLTVDQVFTYAFYALLLWLLLLVKLFHPSIWTLLWYMIWGTAAGTGGTYAYFKKLQRKEEVRQVLSFDPGLKGLNFLCGELPTWLSSTEREKVNWLNSMLTELWPFYDKAVCDMIKGMVEPLMNSMKPSGIKTIKFKNLTFGTAPFRIEDMLVVEEHDDEVLLEVSIRWAGDANITMAVDLPTGGDFTRMCPKITDMSFMGTARISLRPLIDTIPCFGFVMVSFRRPPLIKYKLDFGKALGGSAAASMIKNFIEPFVEDFLVNQFVWPNRFLVPIVTNEDSQREMEKLKLRDVGVMRVKLARAKGLKSYDMNGKSDPTVTLWIDPLYKRDSKVVKSTLEPDFKDEAFYLLVQEPKDQYLRLEMFDVDFFNAEKLASSWKVWQGVSKAFNAKTHMGRSMINVKKICAAQGREVEGWYPLGKGEWGEDEGPGKGEGEIYLKCSYHPFSAFTSLQSATKGMLVVRVFKCVHVEVPKGNDGVTVYLSFKLGKQEHETRPVRGLAVRDPSAPAGSSAKSGVLSRSMSILKKSQTTTPKEYCDPEFDVKHVFFDVDLTGVEGSATAPPELRLKLMADGGTLGPDASLGHFNVKLSTVQQSAYLGQEGRMNGTAPLEGSTCEAKMNLEIMFIPYF